MIALMKELGLEGIWGTSTQNPYLFPLNIWMVLRLWNGEGDVEEAVSAWANVEEAAGQVVVACRNVPNTDLLADHWRRLALLPERLRSLRKLLPELAERKGFRDIVQRLEMREVYEKKEPRNTRDAQPG